MSNLSLSEFSDQLVEIMPVISREFYKKQTGEFYKMKITMPQFVVLEILHREGQSRMTDLARLINVSTAAMTGIVDRLVRDGYLARASDPDDRRIIKVDLTVKGSKAVKNLHGEYWRIIVGARTRCRIVRTSRSLNAVNAENLSEEAAWRSPITPQ